MGASQTKDDWYDGCSTPEQVRVMWDMLVDGQLFADVRAIEALLASLNAMTTDDFAVGPTVLDETNVCVDGDQVARMVASAIVIDTQPPYRGVVLFNHHLKTVEFYDLYNPWSLLPKDTTARIRTCFVGWKVVPPVDRVPKRTPQAVVLANTPLASSCVFRSVWSLWTRTQHPTTKPEDLMDAAFMSVGYDDTDAVRWGDKVKPNLMLDAFVNKLARQMASRIDYRMMIRRCVRFSATDAECTEEDIILVTPPPRPPSPTAWNRFKATLTK